MLVSCVQRIVDVQFVCVVFRLAAFRDSWPKLEKWFSKFGILRTVDTAISENVVFLEIEKIFKTIVASVISFYMYLWNYVCLYKKTAFRYTVV